MRSLLFFSTLGTTHYSSKPCGEETWGRKPEETSKYSLIVGVYHRESIMPQHLRRGFESAISWAARASLGWLVCVGLAAQQPPPKADNTRVNKKSGPTADQQKETEADRKLS